MPQALTKTTKVPSRLAIQPKTIWKEKTTKNHFPRKNETKQQNIVNTERGREE